MIRRLAAAGFALGLAVTPLGAGTALAAAVAVDDSYSVLEDHVLVVEEPGLLANDTHDGGLLTDLCVSEVDTTDLDGTLSEAEDGSFTFTPAPNFSGETTFEYEVTEKLVVAPCVGTAEDTGTVTITVVPVNDAPTIELGSACDGGGVTVDEDAGAFEDGPCVRVVSFGPGEDDQAVTAWTVTSNSNPGLFASGPSVVVAGETNGRLQFTPAANAHGSATISVRGRDDGGTTGGGVDVSNELSFTITVRPVNDAPSASPDSFIALPDRTLNIGAPGVLVNDSDVDGDPLTAVKVANPSHGRVTLAADGSFSYTPAAGYVGLDAFSYRAYDGSALSAAKVVTLNVAPIPTPVPTVPPPTAAPPPPSPSVEASTEPSASAPVDASPSLDPGASPGGSAGPSADATIEPGASPVPGETGDSGGPSIPVLVVLLLLGSLVAFGAAFFVPKWLESRRTGKPIDGV